MAVQKPAQINAQFADGFNGRDVEALLDLYDPDGSVVEPDGSVSVGTAAIRGHLERLVGLGGRMVSTNRSAVVVGDIALVTADWQIPGSEVVGELSGQSAEVLRRRSDGSWVYVIDQPLSG
ncbi:MAG: YybH family protein [Ilumatobacteraceae bacterium]